MSKENHLLNRIGINVYKFYKIQSKINVKKEDPEVVIFTQVRTKKKTKIFR